jgi:cyclopropane-fatty-acyl-phospholipid synthase
LLLNRNEVEAVIYGSFWGSLAYRIKHWFNKNTKAQAKKNIHAHYDLGNAFYSLWLDPTMTYSSAMFADAADKDMIAAQHRKYQAMIDWIHVEKGASILEIGCGWGGFAEKAAQAGAKVTALTLSTEQLAFAKQRLAQQGLAKNTDFRLQDYRDCKGQFDGIASIEMFEAVGEQYWPSYFESLANNLRKGGRAAIQTIVIAEELFDRYRKSTDFIQQYIFPGGMLPSVSEFTKQAERVGLKVVSSTAFGKDYAKTLKLWRESFKSKIDEVMQQGFDEPFVKTWDFYLAYCEAGFAHSNTDVVQFYLEKS